tara:strand:- start:134 stop:742 length:609 start_codon:yes stop_codon:yes gene_type:complete
MANNLKSFVEVKGNEKVVKLIDSLIDKVNGNESDSSITAFATAFYDDVDLTEDRGVLNTWSYDKLGSKWTTLYDVIDQGAFSIESAWYPPKKFFIHLYNLCFPLDNEVVIEVKYEDETFDPVGALVIKTLTHEGDEGEVSEGRLWVEETEMEDPTVDMDWDHEDYDQTQMEFYESVAETQDNLLSQCMELVETDGLSFEDVD